MASSAPTLSLSIDPGSNKITNTGFGKPEPLKSVLAGCWPRRITQEHRLVYRVSEKRIDFLPARYHY